MVEILGVENERSEDEADTGGSGVRRRVDKMC